MNGIIEPVPASVEITETGLRVDGELTKEQWEQVGHQLARANRSLMWLIGDWLLIGESGGYLERGKLDEACERFGVAYDTAKQATRVCRDFERCRRLHNLSFGHHQSVAGHPEAAELLEWASENGASVKQLRDRKKELNRTCETLDDSEHVISDLSAIAGKQFGTIYADPPWKYGNQSTRASTDNHYGTMSVDDICEMPIKDLASDDAHLHLWTTNAFLFEAKRVMEAWGFEYRSVFVWVKPQMGIGNYWRVSHEYMLLGIRGNAKRFNERCHKSWAEFDRTKHSAKPAAIRKIVEKVSPGPFLELFGRQRVAGWTVFGNQIEDGDGLF